MLITYNIYLGFHLTKVTGLAIKKLLLSYSVVKLGGENISHTSLSITMFSHPSNEYGYRSALPIL